MSTEPNERGRPRDEAVDRSVLEATRTILEEDGWEGLSIEGVARAAGVGKSSVYRRWPNKVALALDATMEPLLELAPGTGLSDGLARLIDSTADDFARTDFRAALPGLVTECLMNTRQMNERRLDPEIALVASLLGSNDAEAPLVFDLYVGAILMRVLRGAAPTPDFRARLLEVLLRGLDRGPSTEG